MRLAMRRPSALAVAAIVAAFSAPAKADKPVQPGKAAQHDPGAAEKANKAQQPGKPAHAADPARPDSNREPGSEGRAKADEARDSRGKSEDAHARAPGQNPDARDKRDERAPS